MNCRSYVLVNDITRRNGTKESGCRCCPDYTSVLDTYIIALSGNTIGKVEIIGLGWSYCAVTRLFLGRRRLRCSHSESAHARYQSFRKYRPFITAKFAGTLHSREIVWDILFSCAFIATTSIARPLLPLPFSTFSSLPVTLAVCRIIHDKVHRSCRNSRRAENETKSAEIIDSVT